MEEMWNSCRNMGLGPRGGEVDEYRNGTETEVHRSGAKDTAWRDQRSAIDDRGAEQAAAEPYYVAGGIKWQNQ